jgi:hypothetical protein
MGSPSHRRSAALKGWPALRIATLLGLALLAPTTLPAGGGQRRLPELRRRQTAREPLLSPTGLSLLGAPEQRAPVLTHLDAGVPLRVLQRWLSPEGRPWLRVEAMVACGKPARGWLSG